jgi:hypothetical protein
MSDTRKPKSWDECSVLALDQTRLNALIRVRLIDLAFNQDSAVAIRAIELLQAGGAEHVEDDLSNLSTEELQAARTAARGFINTYRVNGRKNGND